jgi:purine-binding chemotaxis protein CheW
MVQLFIFSAGGVRYAIPLTGIQSVIQMMEVTPATVFRKGVAGEINLHGRIIPVFSLSTLMGTAGHPPRLSDMLVITRAGDETVALWIDDTRGVEELELPSPRLAGDCPASQGTCVTDTGIVIISDLPAFLLGGQDTYLPDTPGLLTEETKCSPVQPEEEKGLDSCQIRAIFSERAAKMLQPESETSVAEMAEILRFQLAYQDYAIEMKYVREVILTGEITPIPGTPDFISGICAARGQIISLVDLRALFRIPEKGLTDLNRVIVITDGKITFGVLADSIGGAGTIALDQIVPPHQEDLPGTRRYLKGSIGENIFLLDAAAIMGDPGIIVDDA